MTRYQVPAFGHWNFNFYDEISISQYFESAREAGLVRPRLFGGDGEDLFRVLSPYKKDQQTAKVGSWRWFIAGSGGFPLFLVCSFIDLKGKKGGERRGGEKLKSCGKQELRKPKAVDEDLYKVPPEMFDQMPKKASPSFQLQYIDSAMDLMICLETNFFPQISIIIFLLFILLQKKMLSNFCAWCLCLNCIAYC